MKKILDGHDLENRLGEIRIIETFLWKPRTINHERRWLEKCKIKQEVCEMEEWCTAHRSYKWYDREWIN